VISGERHTKGQRDTKDLPIHALIEECEAGLLQRRKPFTGKITE
jgi:hypothetical protein